MVKPLNLLRSNERDFDFVVLGKNEYGWEGRHEVGRERWGQHAMPAHEEQNYKEQVNKINRLYKDKWNMKSPGHPARSKQLSDFITNSNKQRNKILTLILVPTISPLLNKQAIQWEWCLRFGTYSLPVDCWSSELDSKWIHTYNINQYNQYVAAFPSRRGFPGGSGGKESTSKAGNPGSISGSGRAPGEGNSYPLQYSSLGNSMDRGAWQAIAHVSNKELDTTERGTLPLKEERKSICNN